ncbi:MAG: hypothetical protein M3R47_18520, partial [Chloroflexota bacterium]|nr:hypothetical protein [Chloroflexota bacterium]
MATNNYGNLEIMVEDMTQEQLDELTAFVTEKVEAMGLVMVARAFISTEEEIDDAEEPESI